MVLDVSFRFFFFLLDFLKIRIKFIFEFFYD